MARRASLCHKCTLVNIGVQTGSVNGKPVYGTTETKDIPCRFYALKGPVTKTESGSHRIEELRIRVPLDTKVQTGSTIKGQSTGYSSSYTVSSLPEVVYSSNHPAWLECSLTSVDGAAP